VIRAPADRASFPAFSFFNALIWRVASSRSRTMRAVLEHAFSRLVRVRRASAAKRSRRTDFVFDLLDGFD